MTDETQATVETDGNDTAAVLAAASGEKTYLPEKATAEPDGGTELEEIKDEPGDEAAAATDEPEAEAPKPKPKQTAQERFDEMTRARRDAEREAEFWKAKALQASQPAQEAQNNQPEGDGRPYRDEFATDDDFIEALTDWKAEQAAERHFARRTQAEQVRAKVSTFETRAKTLYPNGEPAGLEAFKALPELPIAVMEIVGESEIGPRIAEHLGANPAELRRLEGLSPIQQARELTRLETRLEQPAKPSPKIATDAPEPAPQARGSGGQFKVAPDTGDFAAFEAQYRIDG